MVSLGAACAMLVIAGYCAARLARARRRQLSGTRLIDVSHVVMGLVMAGMFVPALLLPVPMAGWVLVFVGLTIAFLSRLGRSMAAGRGGESVMYLDHVLVGAAMLIMLVGLGSAGSSTAPGAEGAVPVLKVASMHHGGGVPSWASTASAGGTSGSGSALLVTLALMLAAYLVMAAARQAVAALRSARVMATKGPGDTGWLMAPTWMLCCDSVMAAAMAAMLWVA